MSSRLAAKLTHNLCGSQLTSEIWQTKASMGPLLGDILSYKLQTRVCSCAFVRNLFSPGTGKVL